MREQERSSQNSQPQNPQQPDRQQSRQKGADQQSRRQSSQKQSYQDQPHQKQVRQQQEAGTAHQNYGSVSAADIAKYIRGVDFPCDKEDLIDCATDNDAPEEILDLMEKFPEQDFNSPVEVAQCFSRIKH